MMLPHIRILYLDLILVFKATLGFEKLEILFLNDDSQMMLMFGDV
jgi:hypothetical protein